MDESEDFDPFGLWNSHEVEGAKLQQQGSGPKIDFSLYKSPTCFDEQSEPLLIFDDIDSQGGFDRSKSFDCITVHYYSFEHDFLLV